MKLYEVLLPEVLVDVPGCPSDMAVRAIRNTVIEFCEKSLIQQATLDPITLITGVNTYDLDAPTGFRIHKVMKVWFNGKELAPMSPDMMPNPDSYLEVNPSGYTPTPAPPTAYGQREDGTLTFLEIPDRQYTNAVTIRAALAPLRDSTKFDDFVYEQWAEIIGFGAKARLQINPGKPYTNVEAAQINQARYMTGLNDARQRAVRGNVRSHLSVKMRKV